MRKLLQSGTYLILCTLLFTSCEPWEDESYHPGGNNNGGGLLLKEVKTTTNGLEGKATYTYDTNNRVKEVFAYADILDMQTYSHTVNTYSGEANVVSVTTMYVAGVAQIVTTVTGQINGNIFNMEITMAMGGEVMTTMTNEITFSAPCGITQNSVNTVMMGMPPIETLITYQYTDANCSFKEFQDGVLTTTVTNDDKFSPYTTPENYSMGIIAHNAVKYESTDGSIQNVAYTYNEDNYPIKAVHTFSGTSTEQNYTEEFTYY